MDKAVTSVLERAVANKVFPGAVVGVYRESTQKVIPFGTLDYSDPVTKDTIYDVASITKAIPTSSLALSLVDSGQLSLENTITEYIPEFRHSMVTIWHLLTQTLALEKDGKPLQLSVYKNHTPDEILEIIYHAGISSNPGSTYAYSNASSILLGIVVEKITGQSLTQLAQDTFFKPLGMTHTSFHPDNKESLAPSEVNEWRGREIRGEVHDESAYTLSQKMSVGSAGLFSTASDLLIFLQMLLQKGVYHEKKYFSERLINDMMTNQLKTGNQSTGLGWELDQPQYMGIHSHPHMIGKTGFTGCCVVVDIPRERAFVLLCNFTYPHRKSSRESINDVRRQLADIVFASKTDL